MIPKELRGVGYGYLDRWLLMELWKGWRELAGHKILTLNPKHLCLEQSEKSCREDFVLNLVIFLLVESWDFCRA